MSERLTIGFLPLVDACLPILAHEHGFAQEEGLELTFVRDMSWATVLDRLLYGHTDAAHMLAPLAMATTLGRGRPARPLVAPFVLGLNGNAITFRNDLADVITEPGTLSDPAAVGARLRDHVREGLVSGRKLRFGVVHRYSSHNYKLRYWLSVCGIRPDEDVEIVTVAPPFVADSMQDGEIDAACVGEPWNSLCVERDVGTIVLSTAQIWRRGVEKVLALRVPTLDEKRPQIESLIRAMRKAGAHFVAPENWEENAAILARPTYLDNSEKLILRAISDRLELRHGLGPVHHQDFMFQYSEAANFPWISQAQWLYTQMVRWDVQPFSRDDAAKAAGVFRPDVYRSAVSGTGDALPSANSKVEGSIGGKLQVGAQEGEITLSQNGFFDGRIFDPDDIEEYVKRTT